MFQCYTHKVIIRKVVYFKNLSPQKISGSYIQRYSFHSCLRNGHNIDITDGIKLVKWFKFIGERERAQTCCLISADKVKCYWWNTVKNTQQRYVQIRSVCVTSVTRQNSHYTRSALFKSFVTWKWDTYISKPNITGAHPFTKIREISLYLTFTFVDVITFKTCILYKISGPYNTSNNHIDIVDGRKLQITVVKWPKLVLSYWCN
jgi:hypothetical protein